MKYVSMSFDDGRMDTYTRALPILKKYHINATWNIVSDFVEHPERYKEFASGGNKAMSIEQVIDANKSGIEIACHGHKHNNTQQDILQNVDKFRSWGLVSECFGFASPHSYIDENNSENVKELIRKGAISYVRSGKQIRREKFWVIGLFFLQEITHSKYLFYMLNKSSCFRRGESEKIVYGISITRYTRTSQIKYLLRRLPEESCAIFIFHSILGKQDEGYGADKWFWDISRFETLCQWLNESGYKVVNTRDLFDGKAIGEE